ncbi:hypothetical protein HAX54_049365 [Datura stramonium]|uniref:Uncharacterized protein n=1 Tax=Datura stramonium TaxID=4076 RepID=A0ABS8WMK8_DATST|nr:hypothetical protein [Datura stramonium]
MDHGLNDHCLKGLHPGERPPQAKSAKCMREMRASGTGRQEISVMYGIYDKALVLKALLPQVAIPSFFERVDDFLHHPLRPTIDDHLAIVPSPRAVSYPLLTHTIDVDSSYPGVEEGPKGSVVRRFKWLELMTSTTKESTIKASLLLSKESDAVSESCGSSVEKERQFVKSISGHQTQQPMRRPYGVN